MRLCWARQQGESFVGLGCGERWINSRFMTLEPGDLIATGTPGGIAPVERGDLVECTITGLGTLANRVV